MKVFYLQISEGDFLLRVSKTKKDDIDMIQVAVC